MTTPDPSPISAPALQHAGTQQALARYRQHWAKTAKVSWRVGAAGAILPGLFWTAGLMVAAVTQEQDEHDVGLFATMAGIVVLLFFVVGLPCFIIAFLARRQHRHAGRMEWILSNYPWQERHHYRVILGGKRQFLWIYAEQAGPEARYLLRGGSHSGFDHLERLRASAGYQPLLLAGDPRQWAVVALPDLQDLYTIRPL